MRDLGCLRLHFSLPMPHFASFFWLRRLISA
jgi:hypothetical protein